ncbi:unknown [[Ruminococcus] torques CAG:61]|uniref:Uncharacterized protein n=1 Tax=[Ruminococcus] torques CAG:61 TaxID=1263108 RepID=R5QLK1_9FIRM|nr:unknown [[Ruminococcus] torques CAG:61]
MASPCSHLAPAVKHCDFLHAVRCRSFYICIKRTELVAYLLYIIKEFRELKRKFKITAVSDTIDRFSKDCSSCCHPVIFCFFDRISVLVEHIREEVRQQTSFCIFHSFDITDQTKRRTVSYASYNSVNTKCFKLFHKRLCSDPVISEEHHCFFTTFVRDLCHLFYDLGNFSSLERLKILKFFARNTILIIVISLIDNIFRAERISHFFFKLF